MNDRRADFREKLLIALIVAGAVVFYLPFLSRQFIGDDWLWLYNAKSAAKDPSIFFERPMYGYFRPLNMAVIFAMLHIFGPHAWIFSLGSVFLHCANVFLLWTALRAYGVPKEIRLLAPFIFAFYYLNISAIEWISVGHDLWVTGLILIFMILLKKFHERPDIGGFSVMFAVGLAAALFKESGLIAIALYFGYLLLSGANPFAAAYRKYSLLYIVFYSTYIIIYFQTRAFADKQIEIGLSAVVNTIYFITYLLVPLAKRVADGFSPELTAILNWMRILVMPILTASLIYAVFRGSKAVRIFIIMMVLFIGTVAVFKWNLSLFSPYPEDPASRFMYSPFVGMAVFLGRLIGGGFNLLKNMRVMKTITAGLAVIYIAANFAVVADMSTVFADQQRLSQRIIDGIQNNLEQFSDIDSVIVVTDNLSATEQMISSNKHLPAILYVIFDKKLTSHTVEDSAFSKFELGKQNRTLTVGWDDRGGFVFIHDLKM